MAAPPKPPGSPPGFLRATPFDAPKSATSASPLARHAHSDPEYLGHALDRPTTPRDEFLLETCFGSILQPIARIGQRLFVATTGTATPDRCWHGLRRLSGRFRPKPSSNWACSPPSARA